MPGTTISLTTSWPSRCARTFGCSRQSALSSSGDAVEDASIAVADLAVDLADEHERVGLQQRRVGRRPGLLPDALAGEPLVDVRATVRREGEDQRAGGGDGEAQRARARPARAARSTR